MHFLKNGVKSVALQSAAIKLSPIFIGLAHSVLLLLLLPESRHSPWHFRAEQIFENKMPHGLFLNPLNINHVMAFEAPGPLWPNQPIV